jgi:predicted O-methyltransferase YrrM
MVAPIDLHSASAAATIADLLGQMTPDPTNGPPLVAWLREQAAAETPACDLRMALYAIASRIKPARYLEIGVRRGWSMAAVLAACPTTIGWGVDLWVQPYARADNPGRVWVEQEIERVVPGAFGRLLLVADDSHALLPTWLGRRRFDLILVDGDHAPEGAALDLDHAGQMLRPGGVLVFDDCAGPLLPVWHAWTAFHKEWRCWVETNALVPFGVAVREG